MAKEFIEKISDRRGIRLLALPYLMIHINEDVPLRDIADYISCHPSSVSNALDPLLEDPLFSHYLEKRKIRHVIAYHTTNDGPISLLKKLSDLVEEEFQRRDSIKSE